MREGNEGTGQDYGTKALARKQSFPDNTIALRMIKHRISSIEANSSKSLEFCQVGEEDSTVKYFPSKELPLAIEAQ